MKKTLIYIYTVLRVAFIPLVFAIPSLTAKPYGENGWQVAFPIIYLLPIFLIIEFILNKRYRNTFAQLPTRYWVITGAVGFGLTTLMLILTLPDWPLHKDVPNLHSVGFILSMIIFAAVWAVIMTLTAILARRRTVGLYKKEELFR